MASILITNMDDSVYELKREFQQLALLVPTVPLHQCLSEAKFLEFVIAYIQQLQESL